MITFSFTTNITDSWPEVLCQAWETARKLDPNIVANGLRMLSFSVDASERSITYEFAAAEPSVDKDDIEVELDTTPLTETDFAELPDETEQGDMD